MKILQNLVIVKDTRALQVVLMAQDLILKLVVATKLGGQVIDLWWLCYCSSCCWVVVVGIIVVVVPVGKRATYIGWTARQNIGMAKRSIKVVFSFCRLLLLLLLFGSNEKEEIPRPVA